MKRARKSNEASVDEYSIPEITVASAKTAHFGNTRTHVYEIIVHAHDPLAFCGLAAYHVSFNDSFAGYLHLMPTEQELAWAATWKAAGPKLQAIRDEELRQRRGKGARVAGVVRVFERNPHLNGMVTMQAWFTRLHLLNSIKQTQKDSARTGDNPTDG